MGIALNLIQSPAYENASPVVKATALCRAIHGVKAHADHVADIDKAEFDQLMAELATICKANGIHAIQTTPTECEVVKYDSTRPEIDQDKAWEMASEADKEIGWAKAEADAQKAFDKAKANLEAVRARTAPHPKLPVKVIRDSESIDTDAVVVDVPVAPSVGRMPIDKWDEKTYGPITVPTESEMAEMAPIVKAMEKRFQANIAWDESH